ncbi:mechanosensitive ion channel family protein [Pareuzebyella sediminis]|uniref:mechanosensitive ion channel family protein n=1 Tax=Pareuzebyella sediminis TaxID=2607998 RepID=UPI0011EF6879|nr:mechanosensitive ion channel family protein [Pareuzebyella sediminis]
MKEQFENAWSEMIAKLESWFDALILNLPNILIAIFVFIIALISSRYISNGVSRLLDKTKLQASMKSLLSKMVSIAVVLLGIFLVLGILNLSRALNTILAGAGVVGLAVGLALQGALANTYSGIVLSYIKHIKFGDWIETNGFEGEVVDLDLRSVTLKQPDNNLVYLPNKLVVENPIKNFSTTAQSRVILNCGVEYSSDLEFVRNLVQNTILENFGSIDNRDEIIFLYQEFGDSSINFETRFWIESTSALEVAKAKTDAMIFIKKAFDENNINIPFPIRTLDFPERFTLPQEGKNISNGKKNNNGGSGE